MRKFTPVNRINLFNRLGDKNCAWVLVEKAIGLRGDTLYVFHDGESSNDNCGHYAGQIIDATGEVCVTITTGYPSLILNKLKRITEIRGES